MPSFALAIFTGAFLLFQVQPLIGKFVLPWFGGSPAVWTSCMLFFQILLLGGYAYAHWLTSCVKPRKGAAVHGLMLIAALVTLPIVPSDAWKPDPAANPTMHILLLLLATIGMPYFVLSSTGPLMQKWFAWLHPGRSPYRLYALSNIGSLLALVTFPFLFEPSFTRLQMSSLWAVGLLVFVGFCGWCTWRIWKWGLNPVTTAAAGGEPGETIASESSPTLSRKALWLAMPAVASALLLAVTNKLCQDVAVIPFLWVLPLCLYLLTFILCFDDHKWYWRRVFIPLIVVGVAGICKVMDEVDDIPMWWQIVAYCGTLFACCMVCHGELYRLRPGTDHLTGFYLMVSIGGALGGIFVAIIAPLIFVTYIELHWTLAACVLLAWLTCRPDSRQSGYENWHLHVWLMAVLTVGALGYKLYVRADKEDGTVVAATRNFYGSLAVLDYGDEAESGYHLLRHGRITHGFQLTSPEFRNLATSYYGESSGVGLAVKLLPLERPRRIAVVGLGVGTMARYARPGDTIRFYEINPEVRRLAETHFTYLKDSGGTVDIAMGDARLTMEREQPQNYDLIVLDAFSSDAIPVHLLTREAFEIYQNHLNPEGAIAVHISNRYLDLEPVVQKAANHFDLGLTIVDRNDDDDWWVYASTWVLVSASEDFHTAAAILMVGDEGGHVPSPREVPLWTDDYTSLFGILHD